MENCKIGKNCNLRLTTLLALKILSTTQYETNPIKKIELLHNSFFLSLSEANLSDIPDFDYPRLYTLPPITPQEIYQVFLQSFRHIAPEHTGIPNFIF